MQDPPGGSVRSRSRSRSTHTHYPPGLFRCKIHHGPFDLKADLADVLRAVSGFLAAHPTEAILARVVEPEYVPDTDPNNGRWVVLTWAASISWVGGSDTGRSRLVTELWYGMAGILHPKEETWN